MICICFKSGNGNEQVSDLHHPSDARSPSRSRTGQGGSDTEGTRIKSISDPTTDTVPWTPPPSVNAGILAPPTHAPENHQKRHAKMSLSNAKINSREPLVRQPPNPETTRDARSLVCVGREGRFVDQARPVSLRRSGPSRAASALRRRCATGRETGIRGMRV